MKIAVFCPNWVGDMVMATPALRAIRRQFSRAEIVAVVRPYVADVLDGLDLVDRRILHDPWKKNLGTQTTVSRSSRGWQFARRLRAERFDVALVLPNSFRSALWAWVSGARRRIGFSRDGRGMLLTDPVAPRPRNVPYPVIDEYLRLARRLGCQHLTRRMELSTSSDDDLRLKEFWDSQNLGAYAARGVVCLNPGGAFGAAKHWPVTSFAQLALRMALECHKRVLVLCGPAERDEARQIVRLARHPAVVSLADEPPSIGLTKSAVRNAELLVTTDSGPRHFAPPFQVPVVTLFGPTHSAWSETYYKRALHLQVEVDCGPCQQRVCPLRHHRCMRDLTVGWVFKAATTLLESFPATSKAA
jgi:heptosyltransferase-2